MDSIPYIDRETGELEVEKVYGGKVLGFLYGQGFFSRLIGSRIAWLAARVPLFSTFYGWLQRLPSSKSKIIPFINTYHVDVDEFAEEVSSFTSFNDFFIRKLKPIVRPIAKNAPAVIPADGRYLFYPDITKADGFLVKGQKFDLSQLLQDENLAAEYEHGTLVIARLCPSDYHRFHLPCDGVPSESKLINGLLYSVNPIALKQNIHIFSENKRTITEIESPDFGKVLYIAVGATHVGSIVDTCTPNRFSKKGEEKGYFEFGGSSLLLLFKPGVIELSPDLLALQSQGCEVRCLMGQPMGISILRHQ